MLSSISTFVPPYSGSRTLSPTLTVVGITSPFCREEKCNTEWVLGAQIYLIPRAGAYSNNRAFQNFLGGLLGYDDASFRLRDDFKLLYEDAVEEWGEFLRNRSLKTRFN